MSPPFQPPPFTSDGETQPTPVVHPPQMPIPAYAQPQYYQQQPGYASPPPPHGYIPGPAPLQPPPKRPSNRSFFVVIGLILLGFALVGGAQFLLNFLTGGGSASIAPHNAGMSADQYKASTTDTTVANLDKDGNVDSGKDVHFVATILAFVKDSTGNTAGANVSDPTTFALIQVEFPAGTDITQLNTQDKLEVWGTDDGTQSGQNAFGVTVHEVAVTALYLADQTTGYTTG